MTRYGLLGVVVDSDLELPGLKPSHATTPAVLTCRRAESGLSGESHSKQLIVDHFTEQDRKWSSLFWHDAGYLYRVYEVADFYIAADGTSVRYQSRPDVPHGSIGHVLTNQILPAALGQAGHTIVHAAAVVIDGQAIGFLGRAGAGKSTLATSFALAGRPLISDDCLRLEQSDQQVRVVLSESAVRLWSDAAEALFGDAAQFSRVAHFSSKLRVPAPSAPIGTDPLPLKQVYIIESSGPDGADSEPIQIDPLPAREAFVTLLKSSFYLERKSHEKLATATGQMQWIAERVPFFTLRYPRDHARLPDVRQAIERHV